MIKNAFAERINIYKKIYKYLKRIRTTFIYAFILKIVLIPLAMLTPFLFMVFVDDVLAKRNLEMLKLLVIGYIGLFIIKFFIDMLLTKSTNRLKNRMTFDIRKDIWNVYFSMPYANYAKIDPGDIKMRVDNDITSISDMATSQIIEYFIDILSVVVYLAVALLINWQLSTLLFVVVPLTFLLGNLIGKGTRNVMEKFRTINAEYLTWENETLQMWKEVKAQSIEKRQLTRFVKYRHKRAKILIRWVLFNFLAGLLSKTKDDIFTKLLLYLIGGLLILNGRLTVGALILIGNYCTSVFYHIDGINQKNIQLKSLMPAIDRVIEMLDKKDEESNEPKTSISNLIRIDLNNISFKYDSSKDLILRNISFTIKKGNYIAVVGRSGCGKTSLVKLLLNLFEAQKGSISVNDLNIKTIDEKSLYSVVGAVMQDCYLFNMSIKENLLLAKPDATLQQLEGVCKQADILSFIDGLPDTFDTVIGEKGIKLSGGQRQRIIIAQILLKNPQLIIFDEATSSLDYQSEKKINEAIMELTKHRTVFIVAHRLSSIIDAKKVIVMDEGKIIDIGTHDELMDRCNEYVELFKGQYNLSEKIVTN